ncbi:muscarinic acetylcholine receptor M1-like [Antedon mediterranea]|uniref:muscarinic acetylcholine receptor M1-like n=1 Tax=Antedon mediterranea TaxID=105859 RepID=UPI003AF84BB1
MSSEDSVYAENITSEFELPHEGWVAFIGLWIAALFTIIGNVMVIASFIIYRDIRNKVSHLFLLNLAISDLIVGLMSLPLDNLWRWHDRWPYGKIPCIFWTFVDYTVTTQSAYCIVLISTDRYLLIKKGLSYTSYQTKTRALWQISVSWLISIGFHLIAVILFEVITIDVVDFDEECELNAVQHLPYTITALFVEFLIPLGIVIVLYIKIYANIRERTAGLVTTNKQTKPNKKKPPAESKDSGLASEVGPSSGVLTDSKSLDEVETITDDAVTNTTLSPDDIALKISTRTNAGLKTISSAPKNSPTTLPQKSESPSRRKSSDSRGKHIQAAKMLSILVGVFIICWLPYNIALIVDVVYRDHDIISVLVWDIANYLLWLNSAVNPLLYAYTNVYFRRSFYNMFRWFVSPCCTH